MGCNNYKILVLNDSLKKHSKTYLTYMIGKFSVLMMSQLSF